MGLSLGSYAVLVPIAIHRHEPWADEAQSWLLARDATLRHLWGTLLHYEGTPGLWQTLLHGLIRLGLPYPAYDFVSALLSLIAVYILLRYAPLPLFIRTLLPFTYYLCYQYSVIARSYALIAPLLFAIAALYMQAVRRLALTTILLALLAGISAQAFLMSACIWAILYGPPLLRAQGAERKKLAIAGLLYWCALAFFLISAWPASDVAFATHRGLANLPGLPAVARAGFGGAFTGDWITSLVVIALSAPLLWRGGGWLFFLLATLAFCLFGTVVYAQLWHFGILFLAWLFAIWISAYKTRVTVPAFLALLAAIGVQCYWTYAAIRYDWSHAYSGSPAAAKYLKQNYGPAGSPPGGLYAIGYPTVAIQPYFSGNIYSNYRGGAYWDWSTRNSGDDPAALVASDRREMALVGYKALPEKQRWADVLGLLGYGQLQHFDGSTFWQTRVFEYESFDLYRKMSAPRAASSVMMDEPAQSAQLLDGFYGMEGKSRWTARKFSVLLKAPDGSERDGAELALNLYLPDVQIQHLGPIQMLADVGGRQLPARTFSQPGEFTYTAHVPAELLQSGFVVLEFRLDKSSVGLNGDARELGVVVTEVGLEPPSRAQ